MRISIRGMDNTYINIKDENIKNNNINNILRSVRISLKRKFDLPFDDYLRKMGFKLKKCRICNSEIARYNIDFKITKGEFIVNNIFYKNDKLYCYSKNKNCAGKSMNPNSVEFISKTMNISEEEARSYIHRNNSSPFYIENHSSEEEYKLWQTRDLDFFGDEEKYEKWKDKLKYGHKLDSYKLKYGDVKGEKIWNDIQKKKESCSLNYYLNKYPNDSERALSEYQKRLNKSIPKSSSEEANSFFKKVSETINYKFNIKMNDIITFYKDGSEFQILWFFYDYCILSHKIIIEYNGKIWHPDRKYYTKEEWDNWKHPFNESLTAEKQYQKDRQKLAIALSRGYKVITIWSDKSEEYNMNFILKKIKKYLKNG